MPGRPKCRGTSSGRGSRDRQVRTRVPYLRRLLAVPAPRENVLASRELLRNPELVDHHEVKVTSLGLAAGHVRRSAERVVDGRRELHARRANGRALPRAEVGRVVRLEHVLVVGVALHALPVEAVVAEVAVAHRHRVLPPHRAARVGAHVGGDRWDLDRRFRPVDVPDLGLLAHKVQRGLLEARLGHCRTVLAHLAQPVRVPARVVGVDGPRRLDR
mmetsp:Transcript_25030/g.83229  ORF Transcript_25030/g.83229 Transcript_25030/m.83229 type:complete len:216 (-) Transcript_25030:645-1292(-)